jgi:predicted PurR-regulated permease PerM
MIKPNPVSTGVRIALAVLGLMIALWLIVQLRSILVLLLIATVLATGIFPLVEWLHARAFPPKGWHLPRWLAISLTLLVIFLGSSGLIYSWARRCGGREAMPGRIFPPT